MSRYIDKDKVLKIVNDMTECEDDYERITEGVHNMPSIDIVRCKECKHRVVEEQSWGEYNEYCDLWCDGNGYWASVNADDFCSYGEREGE